MKRRRDAQGQTHGADGGGRFKEAGEHRQIFHAADDHAAQQEQGQIHQQHGDGVLHRLVCDPPSEEPSVFPLAEDRHGAGEQHRNGGGLHAAGGGARAAADEHEPDGDGLACFAQGSQVSGVEARRSGGHRLERRQKQPLSQGLCGKFEKEKVNRRKKEQDSGGGQDHLALHPVSPDVEAVLPDVLPGQKADAADDDQEHDGDVHHRMVCVGGQGGIGAVGTHQIEACVAEGGNGMENSQPDALQPVFRDEHRHQHRGSQQFNEEDALQDKPGEPNDAAHMMGRDGILHGAALHQGDPLAGGHGDGCSHGDHAHAADLDQQQDHRLPEHRPMGGRVIHDQTRHADGGGRGEQTVQKGRPGPPIAGKGKHQHHSTRQDHQHKAGQDNLRRRKPPPMKCLPHTAASSPFLTYIILERV